MPSNKKPRRPYRPRGKTTYPDLHDVGLIYRPMYRLFDQLLNDEVLTVKGVPVFNDWQGSLCAVTPALDGWCDCWERIRDGEGVSISLDATRKLSKMLNLSVPLQLQDVQDAYREVLETQRLVMKIPKSKLGEYMRTEQIAIELNRLGVLNGA